MPEPVAAERRYIGGLDGLRALAVLAVLAYHLGLPWTPGGLLGVGVFFTLSGYLITDLLLGQRETRGNIQLGQFWLRRARRLLPALWLMLAALVVAVAVAEPSQLAALRDDVIAALLYVSNWWYVFHHVSYFAAFGPPSPLGHLWSLAVEEQFYLVWPLLLIGLLRVVRSRRWLLALTLAGAVASATTMALLYQPGGDPNRMYYGTDTRAFELLVGAALAVVWPSTRLRPLPRLRALTLDGVGLLGLGVIGLAVSTTSEYDAVLYRGGMVLVSLAAAAVVATLAHPSSLLTRLLALQPLRWLGVRSYGIYLWHFPVIALTTPLVDTPGVHWMRSALQVTATLLVAAVSWRWLEEPVRRRGLVGALRALRPAGWRRAVTSTGLVLGAASSLLAASFSSAVVAGPTPRQASAQAPPQFVDTFEVPPPTVAQLGAPCDTLPFPRPQATATPTPAQPLAAANPTPVTAVGDSVMIDLAPYLHRQLPNDVIDGKVSRQMYQLPGVLAHLRSRGLLRRRLILELGTNGPFDENQLIGLLRSLGPMDQILLVNTRVPRPWERYVNGKYQYVASQVTHTAVVDWYDASAGHPEYFYSDGVHPNAIGARVMAALIAHAVVDQPVSTPPTLSPKPGVC